MNPPEEIEVEFEKGVSFRYFDNNLFLPNYFVFHVPLVSLFHRFRNVKIFVPSFAILRDRPEHEKLLSIK